MKKEYSLLLSATLLLNLGDNLIGPFYVVYVQKIGASLSTLGLSTALYSIVAGFLIIGIGKISDRINKSLITTIGYALFTLGTLGYLVLRHSWQLYVLQTIFALGTACLAAPLNALFARWLQKGKEGFQWGLEGGGNRIVIGVAVIMGTAIVRTLGFSALFLIMFAIQLIATLLQITFLFQKTARWGKILHNII